MAINHKNHLYIYNIYIYLYSFYCHHDADHWHQQKLILIFVDANDHINLLFFSKLSSEKKRTYKTKIVLIYFISFIKDFCCCCCCRRFSNLLNGYFCLFSVNSLRYIRLSFTYGWCIFISLCFIS